MAETPAALAAGQPPARPPPALKEAVTRGATRRGRGAAARRARARGGVRAIASKAKTKNGVGRMVGRRTLLPRSRLSRCGCIVGAPPPL